MRQRIELKLAVLVAKALNGLSPQHPADDCQLTTTTGRRRPRSDNVTTSEVPRTLAGLSDRTFTVAGARPWNNLPFHLRNSELTPLEFRRLLKTYLLRRGPWSSLSLKKVDDNDDDDDGACGCCFQSAL